MGLLTQGTAEESLVENVRLDAAVRAECLSMMGRTMEAMPIYFNWPAGELESESGRRRAFCV